MAKLLWGKVYYKNYYAGLLWEEPGDRTSFTYDENYLAAKHPAIAHTLPLTELLYVTEAGLLPFFDNLVAEGWLEKAQARLLGKRMITRFELLLAFGQDCAGAVSIVDPEPAPRSLGLSDLHDPMEEAILSARASLSGIQPKLTLIERDKKFYPTRAGELSTHIGKFPSKNHEDLVINEYLTTVAFKKLLPKEDVVEIEIGKIEGFDEPALIIKRFDRVKNERIHFEEFNQLLGLSSREKYEGEYKSMSEFIRNTEGCRLADNYGLYLRILAGILLNNTDMHFKNFAMFHTNGGLRLAPVYDQVAAVLYDYKTIALAIGGSANLLIGNLKPANIIKLGAEFHLEKEIIRMGIEELGKNIGAAKQGIAEAKIGTDKFKKQLIELIENDGTEAFP